MPESLVVVMVVELAIEISTVNLGAHVLTPPNLRDQIVTEDKCNHSYFNIQFHATV